MKTLNDIKWVCDNCGWESEEQIKRNSKCPNCGRQRVKSYKKCECGAWFHPDHLGVKFCSKECRYKYQPKGGKKGKHYPHTQRARIAVCPVCGSEFRATKECKGHKTVYCSKECWSKRATVYTKCAYCGKEFKTYKSANKKFCSNECRNLDYRSRTGEQAAAWQGGKTAKNQCLRTSAAYHEWRVAVFIRDNHVCQKCGAKKNLEAHHIKEVCNYPELALDVENGLTLCHECHKLTDNYANKAKKPKGGGHDEA